MFLSYLTKPISNMSRIEQFPDSLSWITQHRNAIVLRTFSKIYGLAGLRIGYGLTTTKIAGYLNRIRPPFNANTMAQRAALAALKDEEHVARSRTLNTSEMATVRAGLVGAQAFSRFPAMPIFYCSTWDKTDASIRSLASPRGHRSTHRRALAPGDYGFAGRKSLLFRRAQEGSVLS